MAVAAAIASIWSTGTPRRGGTVDARRFVHVIKVDVGGAWVMTEADATGAFVVCAAVGGLDVELVVRVDLFDDACTDAEDFEHACCGTAEYYDGEDDYDQNCGA